MVCNYTNITKPNRNMADCETYMVFKMSKSETAILKLMVFFKSFSISLIDTLICIYVILSLSSVAKLFTLMMSFT